ncbi:PRC-barrel domain-containing protein [Patescibacteria group bacterium]|jgi:sporulation protein YlmC with PRC-barrel domain|nr:PRC-barrel domain-containing protein [Patescibacteria group bacterium]
MTINSKDLIGLPVQTRSGHALGKVASIDVDVDTGRIGTFHVKAGGLVTGLLADELMVSWASVFELTADALIVADTTVPAGATVLAKAG